MLEMLPNMQELASLMMRLQVWGEKHVLTLASLQQCLAVVAIPVTAWALSYKLPEWMGDRTQAWRERYFSLIASRIYFLSAQYILFLLLVPLLLWATVWIAALAGWPLVILHVAANLATAWMVIRFASSLIRSRFWSKTLAFLIGTIAALHIVDWLEPTVEALDRTAISFGEHELTLLALFKGVVIFGLLLWLAGLASAGLEHTFNRSRLSPSQKVLLVKLAKIIFPAVAVLFGLDVVGIDLTVLAVFSGALGIGIGFGLQKVFANLVSGFILLMDKSIKPGDVIAVGNTYGWVNRLGTRCVSILTRDGKEHLVPNEMLITQPVENWTYSNDNVRIHIPVGVSCDADVPLVKQLLLEVAQNHPRILKHPEPTCLIKGFGENSVDFEIRAWIEDPVNGLGSVRSGVYEEVWKVFKEHDIVVPFPQRDLNFNMEQMREVIKMIKDEN